MTAEDKTELVIRLGTSINRLRQAIKDDERKLKDKKTLLHKMEVELWSRIGPDHVPSSPVTEVVTDPATTMMGKVKTVFIEHPGIQFTVLDFVKLLDLGLSERVNVRQTFKRMTDDGILIRISPGKYQLSPSFIPPPRKEVKKEPEALSGSPQLPTNLEVEGLNIPKL